MCLYLFGDVSLVKHFDKSFILNICRFKILFAHYFDFVHVQNDVGVKILVQTFSTTYP